MSTRFGLIQYSIHRDPAKTRSHVLSLLDRIKKRSPHYVALPEMWLGSPVTRAELFWWASFYEESLQEIQRWCADHRIGCFLSGIERDREKYFNTATFIDQKGKVKGKQRKIHLFSLGGETKLFSAGTKISLFQTPFGRAGCVVCYDIRFPELIRVLAIGGMKVLVVCAQWPRSRRQHWLTLLSARAIENQCYVVASNRLGRKGEIAYSGESVIVDPWGKVRLVLGPSLSMGVGELDLKKLERIRKRYPFLKERRGRFDYHL